MPQRDNSYKPRHAILGCGVDWCTDPHCGTSEHEAVGEPTYMPYWLELAIAEFRDARRARLASGPRRVATRFGVATLAFSAFGATSPSTARAASDLTATVLSVLG